VLPYLYPDTQTREAVLRDPSSAPIPQLHREVFRFAEKFVRGSWTSSPHDAERLRTAGLSDRDIALWATLGSTQSWFTMSADGGGIPLDSEALTGPGVGRTRDFYETTKQGLLAASTKEAGNTNRSRFEEIAWIQTDEGAEGYREAAQWAEARYGFIPNLLRAVSLQPAFYGRHRMALELLEGPQSKSLSPRHHAMVRVLVTHQNRSHYAKDTANALLARVTSDPTLADRVRTEPLDSEFDSLDRAILTLATKLVRNAYKVTEKDAIALREAGLDDEAYVDILNTVSIQTSLDRLTNMLGVRPDSSPLLLRA
jgi:uncharacterized peroxidase-related enzyme